MRNIKKHLYSKKGQVLSSIARDCLISEVGDRLPTINNYTTSFHVSRGIVQSSIKLLQDINGIEVRMSGVKGTILTKINKDLLIPYTGWRAITTALPIPLNPLFASMTTALNINFKNLPLSSAFAHTSGAKNRLDLLLSEAFDIIIVSKKSADYFLKTSDSINPPIILENSLYSYPFYLYTKNKEGKLRDGLTVLVDPASTDQYELSKKVFEKYKTYYQKLPYVTFSQIQNLSKADAAVYRKEEAISIALDYGYHQQKISNYIDYDPADFLKPVLLTNKNNYAIHRLVEKYLDKNLIRNIQQRVLRGEIDNLL